MATPANGSTRRRSTKKALESSPADNIQVKPRAPPKGPQDASRSPDQDSASSDGAQHSTTNRPWGRSGKASLTYSVNSHVEADLSEGTDEGGDPTSYFC